MSGAGTGTGAGPVRHGEATLRHLLAADITPHLAHADTEEVVANAPGRILVERDGRWTEHDAPSLTPDTLQAIGHLAAFLRGKDIGPESSWQCSTSLPDGERLKITFPPASSTVTASIRKRAATFRPTLRWLDERGYFSALRPSRDWVAYFEGCIARRWTALICGEIGGSKTTFAEALLCSTGLNERHVTIERGPEWTQLPHRNLLQYYFNDNDPDSAAMRIQDTMQSRPDWTHFQELQGPESFFWKRLLRIGVPGYCTVHAPDVRLALAAVATMQQQSPHARGTPSEILEAELRQYVRCIARAAKFAPRRDGERKHYRLVQVLELGVTPDRDRMVGEATPESLAESFERCGAAPRAAP